jgi:hypothetical protein
MIECLLSLLSTSSCVESAWMQLLKLLYDEVRLSLACKCSLRRYVEEEPDTEEQTGGDNLSLRQQLDVVEQTGGVDENVSLRQHHAGKAKRSGIDLARTPSAADVNQPSAAGSYTRPHVSST